MNHAFVRPGGVAQDLPPGAVEQIRELLDILPQRLPTYDDLLTVFWDNHNPTTMNRQGPDIGTQYRSAIFYHDEEQAKAAAASKDERERSGRHRNPIVTEITPATQYYEAEDYHQQYLEKRGLSSCHIG